MLSCNNLLQNFIDLNNICVMFQSLAGWLFLMVLLSLVWDGSGGIPGWADSMAEISAGGLGPFTT